MFASSPLQVTKALIDMENMFELLATEPRVQDEPHAGTLQVSNGTVEFKQVGVVGTHRQRSVHAAMCATQRAGGGRQAGWQAAGRQAATYSHAGCPILC